MIIAFGMASVLSSAQVQPSISGVIETYLLSNNQIRGASQQLTWAEVHARVSRNWSATWSGFDAGSFASYDESYIRYETDRASIRAGRMRTSFGFSDWGELFYTGINHKPLVREMNLVGGTRLDRDDAGAEMTANIGPLQIQAAALDTTLTRAEVGPEAIDHATVTAQYGVGRLIIGGEILSRTDFSQKIFGGNFRYTVPHWIFKGEYFEGVGPSDGSGSYVTATYRIPYQYRTELVGQIELLRAPGSDAETQLETLGVRQVFDKFLTVNLN